MILTRTYPAELHVREDDGDGRTLTGLAIPYGTEVRIREAGKPPYVEDFAAGAVADDLANPSRIPLTATHPKTAAELPIGVTVLLREETDGVWGDWRVSRTPLGDEVLALAADGVPLGLSVGFAEVRNRGSERAGRVTRLRVALDHVAVVRRPAYDTARVASVRDAAAAELAGSPLLSLARLLAR